MKELLRTCDVAITSPEGNKVSQWHDRGETLAIIFCLCLSNDIRKEDKEALIASGGAHDPRSENAPLFQRLLS